jgi:hypothetical protein
MVTAPLPISGSDSIIHVWDDMIHDTHAGNTARTLITRVMILRRRLYDQE